MRVTGNEGGIAIAHRDETVKVVVASHPICNWAVYFDASYRNEE